MGLQGVQQLQGIGFIANYIIVFLISIGIQDVYVLNMILMCVMCTVSVLSFYTTDKIGRRPLLIGGGITMAIAMYAVAGLVGKGTQEISKTRQDAALGMLFLWLIGFSFTWSPVYVPSTLLTQCVGRVRRGFYSATSRKINHSCNRVLIRLGLGYWFC